MTKPKPMPRVAENASVWSSLAYLLAPAAGCDCQLLAVSIADGLDASAAKSARAALKR